jgi:glycine/D-amino acid oxidase-like deaminating enzyme
MKRAQVVIIGGGITGVSTALHLALRGVKQICVLERHHVAAGQSGRAAGIVRALVAHPAVSAMLLESIQFFREFSARFDQPIEVNEIGYMLLSDPQGRERVQHALDVSTAAGCNAGWISMAEAAAIQPGIRTSDDCLYALEPAGIWTDPMTATQAIARATRALGVTIVEGCQVNAICTENGSRVTGVETSEGTIATENVAICTAAWGAGQLAALGVEAPVYPHRVEMGFFQAPPRHEKPFRCIISDPLAMLYMRPEGDRQLFVGWRETDRISSIDDLETADPDNYRQTARYPSLADMTRRLSVTFPFMSGGFIHRTYSCVYDYTPDGMPILDTGGPDGVHFALGFSGGGFSLSPWIARILAEAIATGRKPEPMRILALSRFREGRTLDWSNAAKSSMLSGEAVAPAAERG